MSVIVDETAGMMLGTKENPLEIGCYKTNSRFQLGLRYSEDITGLRYKLPHGWLIYGKEIPCFIPFAEDGTGWGKNDPADLS